MNNFQQLGLSEKLAEHIASLGFNTPTPVQEQAIPALLSGPKDLLALAATGTGKTAAYGLPLLEICLDNEKQTQALILAPTRELCVQISKELENFSQGVKHFVITAVYGGSSISDQIRKIKSGSQIIVATPGRLMDLMERKAVNLSQLRYAVLDEADEMLNMGFKEDMEHILSFTPDTKNVWLFSATMPKEVRNIANQFMSDPFEIVIGNKNQTNVNIAHQYAVVSERDRYEALKRVLDVNADIYGLIFCRTKNDTQQIAEQLMRDGYNADALHGDLSQSQRDRVMKNFRNRALQTLVATDVAARGIDVNDISHVIHYNLPDEMEYYTHRSGRTARAGKKGISIALVARKELHKIRQIESSVKTQFEKILIPTGKEICKIRFMNLVHRLREVKVAEEEIADMLPAVMAELQEMSKEEVIKRFTSLEFNHLLDYYRGANDLNAGEGDKRERSASGTQDGYASGERMFISLGTMDGLDKGKLLALICDRCGLKGHQVGKIGMKNAYSFFEVEPAAVEAVKTNLHGIEFKGRFVRIEVTRGDEGGGGQSKSKKRYSEGGMHEFSKGKSRYSSDKPRERKPYGDRKSGGSSFGERSFSDRKASGSRSYGDKKDKVQDRPEKKARSKFIPASAGEKSPSFGGSDGFNSWLKEASDKTGFGKRPRKKKD